MSSNLDKRRALAEIAYKLTYGKGIKRAVIGGFLLNAEDEDDANHDDGLGYLDEEFDDYQSLAVYHAEGAERDIEKLGVDNFIYTATQVLGVARRNLLNPHPRVPSKLIRAIEWDFDDAVDIDDALVEAALAVIYKRIVLDELAAIDA